MIITKRLSIQQVKYPLDEQVDWLNDTRNTKYSEQRHYVHDKTSCAEYISKCSMFWGIQEVDSGEWIGTISAHIDKFNEVADIGILIHHEYARRGYGKESWAAVCHFLLETRKLRKIEAGCMATNKAMRQLCLSTGFFLEGSRLNHFLDNDRPVDLVMYGKWPERR